MLTKNAVGNLINRYRAVLDNCRLLNAFGALALATVLTVNPAHAATAPDPITQYNDGTYSIDTTSSESRVSFSRDGTTYYVLQNGQPIMEFVNAAPLFIGNHGGSGSGGVINVTSDTDIISGVFITNVSSHTGGVIANGAGFTIGSLTGSTFIGNDAGRGGAIDNSGTISGISSSQFVGTVSPSEGGVIYNSGSIGFIESSTFTGNVAGLGGGAIFNSGTIGSIESSTFTGNEAGYVGGAIFNEGTINSISNATFENNHADNGSAIYNTGTITSIENSNFTNHYANFSGGAIYSTGALNITNCSFLNNHSGTEEGGGAIYSGGPVTITADNYTSVFSGNEATFISNAISLATGKQLTFKMLNGGVFDMQDGVIADKITIAGDGSVGSAFNLSASLKGATTLNNANIGISGNAEFKTLIVKGGTNTISPAGESDSLTPLVVTNGLQVQGGTLDASDVVLTIGKGTTFNTAKGATLIMNASDMGVFSLTGTTDYFATDNNHAAIDSTLTNNGTLVLKYIDTAEALEWGPEDYTNYIAALKTELTNETYASGGKKVLKGNGLIVIDGLTLGEKFKLGKIDSNVAIQDTVEAGVLGWDGPHTVSFAGIIPEEGDSESSVIINGNSTLTLTGANGVDLIGMGEICNNGTLNLGDGTSTNTLVFGGNLESDGTTNVNGKTTFKEGVSLVNGGTTNINAAGTTFEERVVISNSTLNVKAATTFDEIDLRGNGRLNVQGSAGAPSSAIIASLTNEGSGGNVFGQNAYTQVTGGFTSGLNYSASSGSVLNFGEALNAADLTDITKAMGLGTTPVDSGFISSGKAVLVHNTGETLNIGSNKLIVDSGVKANLKIGKKEPKQSVYFGKNSALIVNTTNLGTNAALDGDGTAKMYIDKTSTLGLVDVKAGTYTILDNFATQNAGWAEGNVYALSDLYKITGTLQEAGTYKVNVGVDKGSAIMTTMAVPTQQFTAGVLETLPTDHAAHALVDGVLTNSSIKVADRGKIIETSFCGATSTVVSGSFGTASSVFNVIRSERGAVIPVGVSEGTISSLDTSTMFASVDTVSDAPKISYPQTPEMFGFSVWAMPFYQNHKSSGMASGSSSMDAENTFAGLVLGADKAFGDWRIGLALNAGEGDVSATDGYITADTDYDFWGLNLYAGRAFEAFGLTAQLAYSHGDYDTTQDLSSLGLVNQETDVTSHTYAASLHGTYALSEDIGLDFADITPYLGLSYMHSVLDDSDINTVAGGRVASNSVDDQDVWTVPFGVTLAKDFVNDAGWTFTPALELGAIYAFGDLQSRTTSRVDGAPTSLTVNADVMDDWTFDGGLSLGLSKEVVDITLSYDVQVSEHVTNHGISAKLGYSF